LDFLLSREQKQVQKLSPMMRQSLEILQMSAADLSKLIEEECAKNPIIEVEDRRRENLPLDRQRSDSHREFLENLEGTVSLEEHLLEQIPEWSGEDKKILLEILAFTDSRGFFNANPADVAKLLSVNLRRVEGVLEALKTLHPYGIGARDLRECLLLQLDRLDENPRIALAKIIVGKYFAALQSGKVDFLSKKLKVSREKIIEAGKLITRLNFLPASGFVNERSVAIIPDLKIFREGDEWVVDPNSDHVPSLRFSKLYREIGCRDTTTDDATWKYLKKQAKSGKRLCDAIHRRKLTLIEIAKFILAHQMDFFEKGPKFMKPLRLKDAARATGLHISTVSRAVREKYVDTPHGIFQMSKFFDRGVSDSISRSTIFEKIREIVEGKKMTDDAIAKALTRQGVSISRRTVAKYRKMMYLPNSRMAIGDKN
jgi:RNA polymerase sigma-54 factor